MKLDRNVCDRIIIDAKSTLNIYYFFVCLVFRNENSCHHVTLRLLLVL